MGETCSTAVPEESVVLDAGGTVALSAAGVVCWSAAVVVVGVAGVVEGAGAASEEEAAGDRSLVPVDVPVAVDEGAAVLDEVAVAVAGTDDWLRTMTVELVADGDAVEELAADEEVVVATVAEVDADEVLRTIVEGSALEDELTVAEVDAVPVTVVESLVVVTVAV